MKRTRVAIGAWLIAISLTSDAFASFLYGDARVIDGDTIEIEGTRLRLFGIDAPEGDQTCRTTTGATWACGTASTERLRAFAALGPVACQGLGLDDFDRTLAICDAYDGTPINAAMVAEGLAWAFVEYSARYIGEEAEARVAGVGIWQAPTTPAWEYRANLRAQIITDQPAPPDGCQIKGNINRDGERIFHVPGGPTYDDTVIRTEDGERWFCTVEEALAAGWRAPYGL